MKRAPYCQKCHSANVSYWLCGDCGHEWSHFSNEAHAAATKYIAKWLPKATDDVRQAAHRAHKLAWLQQTHLARDIEKSRHANDPGTRTLQDLVVKIKGLREEKANLQTALKRKSILLDNEATQHNYLKSRVKRLFGNEGYVRAVSSTDAPGRPPDLEGLKTRNQLRTERSCRIQGALKTLVELHLGIWTRPTMAKPTHGEAWKYAESALAFGQGELGSSLQGPQDLELETAQDATAPVDPDTMASGPGPIMSVDNLAEVAQETTA